MRLGWPHRHLRVIDSTNTLARELAAEGAPGGTVVTAAEQTAGRGRQGRSWTAPAGRALLYSAIIRPLEKHHALLPLAAAVAVCEAAEQLDDTVACRIKWPNDIWVDERKLAGILIEARPQDGWAVVGVGLNLAIAADEFPAELRETATSLRSAPSAEAARAALDAKLGGWVDSEAAAILAAWEKRDALRGRAISWDGGSGVADGVSETGDLLVLAGGHRVALGAGEVHLSV